MPSLSLEDTVPAQTADNLSFPSEMTQDPIMPLIKVKNATSVSYFHIQEWRRE